ncbi:uncharacterized protein LOC127360052 [Dicentrarchus labrax]|uniref:uncharacterized protein LOC127360052 n=1 Tax=Dicentrarchus labrax TaxID=13489 RepID=UPI0021F680A7|nr:uncharacterized protein LOC127360052 [Dicentrarchus labrax]
MHRMTAADDPQTFLEMFEATAEACGWPAAEWAVRLLPLLSGESQTAALGLPASARGEFRNVKRAILDRMGFSPEDHRRRFRSATLGSSDRPFVFAQQLKDAATSLWRGSRPEPRSGCGATDRRIWRPPSPSPRIIWLSTGPAATGAALGPQRVPQASGQECWRCGQPGHFRRECPLMEVGQVVRVAGPPTPSPGPGGTYSVPTDASNRGLGAVLSQQVQGVDRPVLYISRKLSERESRYSTIEKECLAIRWAVEALRYYLLGRSFTLCSDHAPLQWLHRMKDANARITRWYLALQPFKFRVVHRPGAQMAVADFLSRSYGEGGSRLGRMTPRPKSGGGGMWSVLDPGETHAERQASGRKLPQRYSCVLCLK